MNDYKLFLSDKEINLTEFLKLPEDELLNVSAKINDLDEKEYGQIQIINQFLLLYSLKKNQIGYSISDNEDIQLNIIMNAIANTYIQKRYNEDVYFESLSAYYNKEFDKFDVFIASDTVAYDYFNALLNWNHFINFHSSLGYFYTLFQKKRLLNSSYKK